MTADLVMLYCPHCERDCLAEVPPCADGHGERCPDRACVECGAALWWDAPLFELARPRAHRTPSAGRGASSPGRAASSSASSSGPAASSPRHAA